MESIVEHYSTLNCYLDRLQYVRGSACKEAVVQEYTAHLELLLNFSYRTNKVKVCETLKLSFII